MNATPCPLCGQPLRFTLARGRKSGKPSVMARCPKDARHWRGFITDRAFVSALVARLEAKLPTPDAAEGRERAGERSGADQQEGNGEQRAEGGWP